MKKKGNISDYIKSELDKQELTPSHDAWDRLQARMDVAVPVQEKSNFKWWLSAAVVAVFTVSTSVFLFINHSDEQEISNKFSTNAVQHLKDTINSENNIEAGHTEHLFANNEQKDTTKQQTVTPKNNEKQVVMNGNVQIAVNKESQQFELSIPNKKETVTEKKEALKKEDIQKKAMLASNTLDSIKKAKKKKNFVDPNMLLYSIENKENLKESNQSRVVSIDIK